MITEKIIIPLLKAVISGLLLALFVAALYGVSQGVTLWRMFLLVFSGCILAPWLILMLPDPKWKQLPISRIYPIEPKPLKVSINWNDGHAGIFSEMGITRDQFIAWCIGAAEGRSLGENHWCGSRGIFSKGEYHAFRDELINRGLLRPKGRHHAQGFELTGKGGAVMAEIARRFGGNSSSPLGRMALDSSISSPDLARERVRESEREMTIDN